MDRTSTVQERRLLRKWSRRLRIFNYYRRQIGRRISEFLSRHSRNLRYFLHQMTMARLRMEIQGRRQNAHHLAPAETEVAVGAVSDAATDDDVEFEESDDEDEFEESDDDDDDEFDHYQSQEEYDHSDESGESDDSDESSRSAFRYHYRQDPYSAYVSNPPVARASSLMNDVTQEHVYSGEESDEGSNEESEEGSSHRASNTSFPTETARSPVPEYESGFSADDERDTEESEVDADEQARQHFSRTVLPQIIGYLQEEYRVQIQGVYGFEFEHGGPSNAPVDEIIVAAQLFLY